MPATNFSTTNLQLAAYIHYKEPAIFLHAKPISRKQSDYVFNDPKRCMELYQELQTGPAVNITHFFQSYDSLKRAGIEAGFSGVPVPIN